MTTIPTYTKARGYSAGGCARYGRVCGIEGEPYQREVKKNSKSEICRACCNEIAINAGMCGWVAAMMIQKSTISHHVKNETLWFHVSCFPASDPRMSEEIARREKEERKRKRADMATTTSEKKQAKLESEFPEELTRLDERALCQRLGLQLDPYCFVSGSCNSGGFKKELEKLLKNLGQKKTGDKRAWLMRIILASEKTGKKVTHVSGFMGAPSLTLE